MTLPGAIKPVAFPTTTPPCPIASALRDSINQLCCIQYTPESTMQHRGYLVQVDIHATAILGALLRQTGLHYYIFLAKHSSNIKKSDDSSRWWPDWYHYSRDPISNGIVFGDMVIFGPNVTPDAAKYIQWGDMVDFNNEATLLVGLFDFESLSPSNCTRNFAGSTVWMELSCIYTQRGILSPTISTDPRFSRNTTCRTTSSCKRKLSESKQGKGTRV